jgi:hypothetical protein
MKGWQPIAKMILTAGAISFPDICYFPLVDVRIIAATTRSGPQPLCEILFTAKNYFHAKSFG